MFLFNSKKYISEIKKYREDIYLSCKKSLSKSKNLDGVLKIDADSFINCPNDSIDYALMEKTNDAVVIPMDVSWNDVGTWEALSKIKDKDENGNTLDGDIYVKDSVDSYIQTEDSIVLAIGINDLIIVNTKDALLVTAKNNSQDVKEVIENLKNDDRDEFKSHKEVFRPWGSFESLIITDEYQVKKLTVYPLQKLSVQMHYKRSEHWVVVKGSAKITNGDNTFNLEKNESTFIPVETIHVIENESTKENLEIIEVQTGTYFGEDDIIRFEDRYGRIDDNENKK
jgi:mannose-1-phosphate guanylyltransferase